MTVCTALLFFWMYPDGQVGPAVMTASDRMLSDGGLGIEYEASRWKAAALDKTRLILVAGDLTFNSLALATLTQRLSNNDDISTSGVAEMYGQVIGELSYQRAAKRILSPLGILPAGLPSDGAGIQGLNLPSNLLLQLADQMQSETVDCEAIVAGCDERYAHIFRVDNRGIATQHDDIGFVSIGSGGIHASGYFMQEPYNHVLGYTGALLSAFLAKKRAEVAPGVGKATDMAFITGDGWTRVPDDLIKDLEKIHQRLQTLNRNALARTEVMLQAAVDRSAKIAADALGEISGEQA